VREKEGTFLDKFVEQTRKTNEKGTKPEEIFLKKGQEEGKIEQESDQKQSQVG
jgi:hypothetical protein